MWHREVMDAKILRFIALVISILYGAGFALVDDTTPYAAIGGAVVAIAWIAVGMFGRSDER